ncbi:MAG: hypothetical protein GF310_07915 [candidate division Zixibacteria bacterium]|nr:hypothetical protein [candidate division Zixibacteria bacterium]
MSISIATTALADEFLESLNENQKVAGFSAANVYENALGNAMGARFISDKYGFIIDLLKIQSVPQGFFWVKTPPSSDMGEPHTCEHLLLGKGTQGRYVSVLEDMALGSSSAWTAQDNTVYHFNTIAGEEAFYELFEAKLNALLNPDFTDEEIRREVCHVGVNLDPRDSSLSLEEKGTVYTEMVSAFERPQRFLWKELGETLYGKDHPLGNVSGGFPDDIRKMTAEDMWEFHKEAYFLGNMGVIVAIPNDIKIEDFLEKVNGVLERCQKFEKKSENIGMDKFDLPPPATLDMAAVNKVVPAPSQNPDDPGNLILSWPANLEYDLYESMNLEAFMLTFAGGPTSNLYDLFINSETRKIDLGANAVWSYVSSGLGHPIGIGLNGINSDQISESMLDSIRSMILTELENVYNYADGSKELAKFNNNARARMIESKKQLEKLLNTPPMFGFRRAGGAWQNVLAMLEMTDEFRKSVVLQDRFEKLEKLLASDANFWKDHIDQWNLLTTKPHVLASKPDPSILTRFAEEKKARIEGYLAEFRKKYGVDSDQKAIAKFKQEFDKKTAEIEAIAADEELPGFVDNPPMTLDDQLDYEVMKLDNGVKMVASTFDNMTSNQIAIAMRLDVIPESQMVYVPFLPDVLTEIGVIKDGEVVKYEDMRNRLREDVLNLGSFFDYSLDEGRVELVLRASGNNQQELKNGIEWMDAALYSPYLDVDNLSRMMDVVDQSLVSLRNRMKGREEDWVRYPANGYRYQTNPLIMSTNCFLTRTHHYQRLKWLLTDPGSKQDQIAMSGYIADLKEKGKELDREGLNSLIDNPPEIPESEKCQKVIPQILRALEASLVDIPDANLAEDWQYLLRETEIDLMVKPSKVVEDINSILATLQKADNARMYMVSNSTDRNTTMNMINKFAGKLDSRSKSNHIDYADRMRVVERLNDRENGVDKPVYVGLVNNNTSNGVMVFNARNAGKIDTATESVLKYLSGNLYGGGGGHGLFMRTWGAGLAYSNGYGSGALSGLASYYAERCPDIAETMRFVVDVLKNVKPDPGLVDYAIAQAFSYSRAPSPYETRGSQMASDLEDGFYPEKVKAYRQRILELRKNGDLTEELFSRMEDAYGSVLIGYGKPLSKSKDGSFFIIGPDMQFESLEDYIETVESPQKVYKLYPRDFWLTI